MGVVECDVIEVVLVVGEAVVHYTEGGDGGWCGWGGT